MLEVLGAATAVLYLILVTQRRWIAWPVYVLSSLLYMPVFWSAHLYADAALQLYFIGVGLYAWLSWRRIGIEVPVTEWSIRAHTLIIAGIVCSSLVVGYILSHTAAGWFGFADAFIAIGSVMATIMTARRVLDNWWYWIVIDSVATIVFGVRELTVSMVLYGLYTALAVRGLYVWKASIMGKAS